MDARRKTLAAMDKWASEGMLWEQVPLSALKLPPDMRVAKELPPEFIANQKKKADGAGGPSPSFAPTKRQIPENHEFNPKALKPMARMLWAMSVSLGHALAAYRQFTRLKSVTVSPDGLVGGRGYVMSVKDVRSRLYEACEALSSISDTVHDEINAPHWKPKLAELEKNDQDDVEKLLGEAEHNLEDPESEAEDEMEDVEEQKHWKKPSTRFEGEKEPASKIPGAGDKETIPEQGSNPAGAHRTEMKQASVKYSYDRRGNSSVNPTTLPGPRVDHLDRGEQTGPYGSYNQDEPLVRDDWGQTEGVGNEYNYPSEWDNDVSTKAASPRTVAESGLPGDPNTRTEGYDFGIGYGEGNDAHGQGAGGYGEGNPSSGNRGVYGPRADLPDDPGGKMHDTEVSDSTPGVDVHLNSRNKFAVGGLPGDGDEPVARSDYFTGPKGGNDTDSITRAETKLPGQGMPAKNTPTRPRPYSAEHEHMFAEAQLPGDQSGNPGDSEKDLMDTGYKYERDQPYVKWDDDTHNMRQDPLFQSGPVEGPYVKQ